MSYKNSKEAAIEYGANKGGTKGVNSGMFGVAFERMCAAIMSSTSKARNTPSKTANRDIVIPAERARKIARIITDKKTVSVEVKHNAGQLQDIPAIGSIMIIYGDFVGLTDPTDEDILKRTFCLSAVDFWGVILKTERIGKKCGNCICTATPSPASGSKDVIVKIPKTLGNERRSHMREEFEKYGKTLYDIVAMGL